MSSQQLDEATRWGLCCYEEGLYLDELFDQAIAVIDEYAPGKSSPLSYTVIVPMDGAYRDVGDDDTAWGGSRSGYMVFMIGLIHTGPVGRGSVLGAIVLAGPAAVRPRHRQLRQRHRGARAGPVAGFLRAGQVRAARPDQGELRSGERLPPQRQHYTCSGLTGIVVGLVRRRSAK